MQRLEKFYEGKAKVLYSTDNPDLVIQYFKDEATAFDGKKKGIIESKGILNNKISSRIFKYLESKGVKTHFVDMPSEREMVVKRLQIVPIEVVVRNIAAGSLSKRMGVEEGTPLKETILELYYKSDALGDPMINEYHVKAFGLAEADELRRIEAEALKVNKLLSEFFDERGIILVDFKLEFGVHKGEILLGDEVTPDGCRLWDKTTREKMDKDRFRRDLGKVEEAYQEVLRKVME
ncbi:MAG: phosphoribosylaminoimidazolesuccinocarboxamide synthase [Deltaproteobacteria bacterium GWB2_55_19]|nr:MAG: phosphoribosylaminoimidazolesuccinocarboxamide synthase [Deltaproteobacteria bacterium GWB2_55_19]HAO92695.1 phosphoribosylaminoimidazolesuccinocarboxamide synthase [Deltaproteobacteria bacterium]